MNLINIQNGKDSLATQRVDEGGHFEEEGMTSDD